MYNNLIEILLHPYDQLVAVHPILCILTLLVIGMVLILIIPAKRTQLLFDTALLFSLLSFVCSVFMWVNFNNGLSEFQFLEAFTFYGSKYRLGVDGISLGLVLLTTFLIPLCILSSYKSVKVKIKEYVLLFLILEFLLINVFCILDLLFFYIFFEGVLIPMFIIIGVWGSRQRKISASYQFFLYTLVGSLLMLLGVLVILTKVGTTDLYVLLNTKFSTNLQIVLFFTFFASFAVKVPMMPFHIWLPEAHVEAPTAGSVVLAGLLLKLGTYGFIRFAVPMFPEACVYFTPLIYAMSVFAIIYASLTTIRQVDLKKIIAYSSVAHMNYATLGIFSLNVLGIEGSILLMISHGIVSGALFLCVGVLYDRYKTRLLKYYSGLADTMPLFSIIFLFFILANISLPGTSSFVGEFVTLLGVFEVSRWTAILATTGVILGAVYSMWLYNRVVFGNINTSTISVYVDVNRRELYIFIPLIIMVLVLGIYPNVILDTMHVSVANLLKHNV
uniref:NADH dehydrogenase subunit 4 n=1 Tax=Meteora sporadica TaxID=2913902 RepID=UPI003001DDA9|nr:NADH dehydrogenase subunit 4 [Meteora sporadica]